MIQVASVIVVCGLGEKGEVKCFVVLSGYVFVVNVFVVIFLFCSLAIGKSMELGNEVIVEALFKEVVLVLTKFNIYSSMGDFMELMIRRIIENVSKFQSSCLENVIGNELVQILFNVILKYSMDEVYQKNKIFDFDDGRYLFEILDILMESIY